MTPEKLKTYTRKQLAALAKRHRIHGWHPMRKQELIRALLAVTRRKKPRSPRSNVRSSVAKTTRRSSATSNGKRATKRTAASNGRAKRKAVSAARSKKTPNKQTIHCRDLIATRANGSTKGQLRDSLKAYPCDPYWIQVHWELSPEMLSRAEAALGVEWQQVEPIIRVFDVTSEDSTVVAKTWLRDHRIHGDANNWYVQVDDPTRSYKLHIGYLAPSGNFFALARSNTVRTSKCGMVEHTSSNGGRRRPNSASVAGTLAAADFSKARNGRKKVRNDEFHLDAELIVYGTVDPESELTLLGNSVALADDGSFLLRLNLPEGRQLIPAVAVTRNGREQRTIVLAIERNTKELEPRVIEDPPIRS